MAYTDKQKIKMYNDALKNIKEKNLFFIEDVVTLMPLSNPTFYEFWPVESNEFNTIKELLEQNKVNEKIELRKLFKEGASTEKLALYKLICTDVERKALSMNHVDVTSGNEKINTTIIAINKDEQDKINKLLEDFETE